MNILQVIPYYWPATAFGGPLTVCQGLAEHLVGRGHRVSVLTTDVASRTARVSRLLERHRDVEIERVRNLSQRLVRANLYTPIGVDRRLAARMAGVDVVHIHEFFTWLTVRAAVQARQVGLPVVFSGHGGFSLEAERGRRSVKRTWLDLWGRKTMACFTVVQVATRHEGDMCRGLGMDAARIRLIPNGVEASPAPGQAAAFRGRFGLGDRRIVLFAGRLATDKGVDVLLEVAPDLPPGAVVVLAGPAENREDLERPGWRGERVLVTGALSRSELRDAYAAAELFILPSRSEGLPMTALEAMSHGVPVLVSPGCHLPEAEAGGAGLTVEPSAAALRAAIAQLLADPARRADMSRAAHAFVRERFDVSRVHEQYKRLYGELTHAA